MAVSKKSNETAKGPLSGYLFQFEIALLLLSELENETDSISIEQVDDVAGHKSDDSILISLQAKHSLVAEGSHFEDTSYSLWRTLEIWIQKKKENAYSADTVFICSTNKSISADSLLQKLIKSSEKDALETLEKLIASQKQKISKLKKANDSAGKHIAIVVKKMEFALKNKTEFIEILKKIEIKDNLDAKKSFLSQLHLGSFSPLQQDNIYNEFYGWIAQNSKYKWQNGDEAKFKKEAFNDKYRKIVTNPTLVDAIFRSKEVLGNNITSQDILTKRRDLFVQQIEDIPRRKEAKERIIQNAITDYICSDIEIQHIIDVGDYTKEDFDKFLRCCQESWVEEFDRIFLKEIREYSALEKDEFALQLFDKIMGEISIFFNNALSFHSENLYIKNGAFLKLSNIPSIGWHPEWKTKYMK